MDIFMGKREGESGVEANDIVPESPTDAYIRLTMRRRMVYAHYVQRLADN